MPFTIKWTETIYFKKDTFLKANMLGTYASNLGNSIPIPSNLCENPRTICFFSSRFFPTHRIHGASVYLPTNLPKKN